MKINLFSRRPVAFLAAAASLVAGVVTAAAPASAADVTTSKPPVAMAATKSGLGYWVAAGDGGVFSFGDAPFYGSMGGRPLNAPISAITPTPSGKGYWLAARDGGVFAFGDAPAKGSMGGKPLSAPVVGIAGTPSGQGYWMVASDGGIFSFGDAQFYGSMGAKPLNKPVVGMAATPSGRGYRLVASDGGIFSFGDAQFYGSMGDKPLSAPVVGVTGTPSGQGYWMVASDGGIFSFGDARFYGSMGAQRLARPVIGMAGVRNDGYLMIAADGGVFAFGAAAYAGRVVYSGDAGSSVPADATVTPALLKEALGITATPAVSDGLPSLNASMRRGNINSPPRVAAFLATLKIESGVQYARVEGGCKITYCGRGYIQLTGKANYTSAGSYLGRDFVTNRDEVRSLAYSAEVARWYWTISHNLNAPADRLDMKGVTDGVNRGTPTYQSRCDDFKRVLTYYRNHGGYSVDLNAVRCK